MLHAPLNGDLSVRVAVDSRALPWSSSPSGTVWRKRLHLVGPAESGQVTSIVRYDPNSRFPTHDHPGGEEILVLEGVFSDEHGDWPAGTYLLNPEGFRHQPFSRGGCLLFVKLRQFPGTDRRHVALDTSTIPWQPGSTGISSKLLYEQRGFEDSARLERWVPGCEAGERRYERGAELLVLDGELADAEGNYTPGTWLRFPVSGQHRARSVSGCTLYIKEGGHAYLQSA